MDSISVDLINAINGASVITVLTVVLLVVIALIVVPTIRGSAAQNKTLNDIFQTTLKTQHEATKNHDSSVTSLVGQLSEMFEAQTKIWKGTADSLGQIVPQLTRIGDEVGVITKQLNQDATEHSVVKVTVLKIHEDLNVINRHIIDINAHIVGVKHLLQELRAPVVSQMLVEKRKTTELAKPVISTNEDKTKEGTSNE